MSPILEDAAKFQAYLSIAVDKQKKLLSEETGHFSLIRAMHLADLITELNGIDSRNTLKGSKVLIVE